MYLILFHDYASEIFVIYRELMFAIFFCYNRHFFMHTADLNFENNVNKTDTFIKYACRNLRLMDNMTKGD